MALRAAGIRLFQGYLFAKPALADLPQVRYPETCTTVMIEASKVA